MKYITTSLFSILFIFCFPIFGKAQIHPDDSLQLVNLYNAICNDGCTLNWNLEEPSTWSGITFDANGRATSVKLQNKNLTGTLTNPILPELDYFSVYTNQITGEIPDFNGCPKLVTLGLSVNQLTGNIPNFNLNSLETLSLGYNQLSGTIPNFNLPNLNSLKLQGNKLTGQIPDFNLTSLSWLELQGNELSEPIPNFSGCPNLKRIDLATNQFAGSVPILNLSALEWLSLWRNQLTGTIPDFSGCPNLLRLTLSENDLTGNIPNFNLNSLETLSLGYNQLSGTIPNFNLPNLNSLKLQGNKLTGQIPDFNLTSLSWLELDTNLLLGEVPGFNNCPNLKRLDVIGNQLIGNIPNFNLPKLEYLYLGANELTGTIPNFNQIPKLVHLGLAGNQLTGAIPNFTNLSDLKIAYLWDNQLTGTLPDFSNCQNLEELEVYNNSLSGIIPNLNLPNLEILNLYVNNFTSPVPDFSNCPNLKRLDIAANQLTGNVPNYDLPNLEYFSVYDNAFVAPVPDFNNCPKLKVIGLGKNQFSGTVPDYYSDFPDINLVEVQVNNFTCNDIATNFASNSLINTFKYTPQNDVSCNFESDSLQLVKLYITTDGQNWVNTWDLTQPMDSWYGISINSSGNVAAIDLKNNNLTGSLPNLNLPDMWRIAVENNFIGGAIPDFAGCKGLSRINLHENEFTGNVPNFDLPRLKYLILHHNNLSGSLPDFLSCPELIDVWLNNNNLSGSLPDFANSPNLALLYAYANDLSGEIPAFDNHTNLSSLALGGNNLTGTIPDFANCQRLSRLNLESNNLSGAIPDFNLPKLKYLILHNNDLSGTVPSFDSCVALIDVWLNTNNLSGQLPDFANSLNLALLNAYANEFSGEIPRFDNHTNLSRLALGGNNLTGTIPDFANCQRLSRLNLESNNLSGTIPDFNLPKLKYLILHNNDLSGITPSFDSCFALIDIWLNHNDLSGQLPDFVNSPNLALVHAFGNNLTGIIPDYSNHVNLGKLHIDYNQFSHEDIATNYDTNNNSIATFNFNIQYYGNEQFRTDTIVGDTVFLSPSPSIPYENPQVRWRKDGNFITSTYALHDTNFVIVDMDTTDVGLYEYWFKDETLTPLVEFRSRPINNTIQGLDLEGEPILAGELIIEFGEQMSDELIALKRDTLRNKFGGTLVKSCGCHKEIDLWRFGSEAEANKVREVFLNGKGERSSINSESDGGQNRDNILTPSYQNRQKLVVSNPGSGMGTDSEIVIAVIDTGVLPTHISVQSALKVNEDEIPGNNIDDDQNGYVDDIYGMNIIDSLAMSDPNGHGTFVAGIITANIPTGHNIKVMLARAFDDTGRGELFDIICSIYYATDNGADIINMSANYKGQMSKALKHAIQYAETQGTMFITSAGNDSLDLYHTETKYWPATFSIMQGINNIITVTALDNAGQLLDDANYSDTIATIAAIGEGIYAPSNHDDEHYDYISGTSVSTPLVALSLGINKSRNPNRPLWQWREDFLNSDRVETVPALLPYVKKGRKLIIEKSEVNIDSFSLKVLLEGAMLDLNGTGVLPPPMRTDLNMRGLLPGQTLMGLGTSTPVGQPYGDSPFCYLGSEGDNITNYPPDVIDWVMVSLRKQATASEVYRTAALLREDGEVTLLGPITAGWTNVPDSVYIVVEHRHHIGIMSHQKVPIINTTITYDFTTQDSYRGSGNTGFGQLQTSDDLWYMVSGNGVHENNKPADINGEDKTIWVTNNGIFSTYLNADYDMSGDVNGADIIIWERHNGKSSRVETLDCSEKYDGN